jgi:predicted nucleic acid-binding protein
MLYIETSVLFAYTLAREKEPERFEATTNLIQKINSGKLQAMTSFYTLMELYALATAHAKSWKEGIREAKACLVAVLQTEILLSGMLTREERILNERRFRMLADSSDVSHAISAYVRHCEQIITYDSHFEAIGDVIGVTTPEKLVTT